LIWIYDNNRITIEGKTSLAFSEDVAARFLAYNWHVQRVADANDLELLERAIQIARDETQQPSLIVVDSHIAYGAPNKQDTHGAQRKFAPQKRTTAGIRIRNFLFPRRSRLTGQKFWRGEKNSKRNGGRNSQLMPPPIPIWRNNGT
jgi:transketolase